MLFEALQKPRVFDAVDYKQWSPFFLSTIVMDIDRMIQVDLGIRTRILGQHEGENLPICKVAKVYFENYVKLYKDDGHEETKHICTEWAKKNGA